MTQGKDNAKTNDTIENVSALERRKQRQSKRGTGAIADWDTVDADLLRRLVATVGIHSGTITFGYTRDGGAYYVNYYVDGESVKEYIRPTEDIDQWMATEIESWQF